MAAKSKGAKAWETRRKNAEKKKRVDAAKKGWKTRRKNMALA